MMITVMRMGMGMGGGIVIRGMRGKRPGMRIVGFPVRFRFREASFERAPRPFGLGNVAERKTSGNN
jgi:hypothetical protein